VATNGSKFIADTTGNAPEKKQRQGEGQEQQQRSSWLRMYVMMVCTVCRTKKKSLELRKGFPAPT
jgi:hypothetical protein